MQSPCADRKINARETQFRGAAGQSRRTAMAKKLFKSAIYCASRRSRRRHCLGLRLRGARRLGRDLRLQGRLETSRRRAQPGRKAGGVQVLPRRRRLAPKMLPRSRRACGARAGRSPTSGPTPPTSRARPTTTCGKSPMARSAPTKRSARMPQACNPTGTKSAASADVKRCMSGARLAPRLCRPGARGRGARVKRVRRHQRLDRCQRRRPVGRADDGRRQRVRI